MHNYRKLSVWQRSRAAALRAYRLTAAFPASERFGLRAQLRRAATSVACNIVEGSKRLSARDFAHFLNIAEGSAAEARFLLEMCRDLDIGASNEASDLAREFSEIERMLFGLREHIH